jgi:two-component system alkaline phosphatase synthesis response regulator PhoP
MAKKILLADDDPEVVDATSMLLEDEGYEVVTAKDGAEALEKIKEENPDLLILDLLMPHVDGFGVFKALEDPAFAKWSKIPIIILTSVRKEVSNRRYELETGRSMSYGAYLEKPAEPDELLATVSTLIGNAG